MRGLIDSEDHLIVHVFKIRPESIQRDIVLIVLSHHLLDVIERFVPPSALVMAEAPEGRDMTSSDELVVLLEEGLRVFLTQDDEEVNRSSN